MRRRVLLLPLRPRRPPRAGHVQGAGGALPEGAEEEAPPQAHEDGAAAVEEVQLRREGLPDSALRRPERPRRGPRVGAGQRGGRRAR